MKKFLPSELQFYAEKTIVHSGQNSSLFGMKLQFCAEKLFRNCSTFFIRYRTFFQQDRGSTIFITTFARKG